jgi:hypothetical protein
MTNFRTAKYMPDGTAIDDPNELATLQTAQILALIDSTRVVATESDIRARFPLRSTLVASKYLGADSTVTFSRNNAGTYGVTTVRDHLGNLQYCRTDEAPFKGARRVENLATDSESFADASGWDYGASCSPSVVTGGIKVTRSAGTAVMLTLTAKAYEPGQHTASATLWINSGSASVVMRIEKSDTTLVATKTITVNTTQKRVAVFGNIPDTSNYKVYFNITAGAPVEFNIAQFQMERTDGQDGSPNDYVARGVAGATYPYQGAGVDGVQYFETLNPCYLEPSGVVNTDTTPGGAAISESSLKGLQRSPIAIQRLFYSSTFDNVAWIKTGVTATQATGVKNPIGYGRVYRLDETAVTSAMTAWGAWNGVIASDNLNLSVSAFFKRNAGRDWVRIGLVNKANVTDMIWYNLATQTLGTITTGSGTVTAKDVVVEAYPNGWYRVGFGGASAGTGGTTPSAFVGIADNDGSSSYLGVVGNSVYVAAAQLEQSDHPTAYIGNSVNVVVQRSGECQVQVPITNNLPANDFTIGVEFTPSYNTDTIRKADFYYIAYSRVDNTNRWGTALSPGIFGGNVFDQLAAGWAQDYYPNASAFGGTNITLGLVAAPFQTISQLFGISSSAKQSNGDGSFMSVNGIVAYSTLAAIPTQAPIANKQTYLRLGSSLQTGKHDACFKNLAIIGRPLTTYELTNAGSYAYPTP